MKQPIEHSLSVSLLDLPDEALECILQHLGSEMCGGLRSILNLEEASKTVTARLEKLGFRSRCYGTVRALINPDFRRWLLRPRHQQRTAHVGVLFTFNLSPEEGPTTGYDPGEWMDTILLLENADFSLVPSASLELSVDAVIERSVDLQLLQRFHNNLHHLRLEGLSWDHEGTSYDYSSYFDGVDDGFEGWAALSQLTGLRSLSCTNVACATRGLLAEVQFSCLTALETLEIGEADLPRCALEDSGVWQPQDWDPSEVAANVPSLGCLPSLTSLILDMRYPVLLHSVTQLTALTRLEVDVGNWTYFKLAQLVPLNGLKHVSFTRVLAFVTSLAPLQQLTSLQHFSMQFKVSTFSERLTSLSGLPGSLTSLRLNAHIGSLDPIMACSALQSLSLSSGEFSSLQPLQHCTQLTYLNCSWNRQLKSLAPVEALKGLRELHVHNCTAVQESSLDLSGLPGLTQVSIA